MFSVFCSIIVLIIIFLKRVEYRCFFLPGMTLCSPDGTPTGFVVPAAWSPCGTISIGWTPTLELYTKMQTYFEFNCDTWRQFKTPNLKSKCNFLLIYYLTTFAAWAMAADIVIGSVLRTDAAAAAAATGPPPLKYELTWLAKFSFITSTNERLLN